ncbi:hypothetical protein [Streptosporangium sp. CA-115845]|uniref:hypothetical protein n=1 Tax=Streptosporangium sp. CA-115845 TaxID=3240071 RepID=UPI003D8E901A
MRIRLVLTGPHEVVANEIDRLGYLYEIAAQSDLTPLPGDTLGDRPRQYVARMTLTPRHGESGEDLVPVRIGDARLAGEALRVMAQVGADLDPQRSAVLAAAAERITPETTTLPVC